MIKQDFDRIKEIAKELNDIRLKYNLNEVQLTAVNNSTTYYNYHKEWNETIFITRGEHRYKDCKIVIFEYDKETNNIEEIDYYNYYINYNKKE